MHFFRRILTLVLGILACCGQLVTSVRFRNGAGQPNGRRFRLNSRFLRLRPCKAQGSQQSSVMDCHSVGVCPFITIAPDLTALQKNISNGAVFAALPGKSSPVTSKTDSTHYIFITGLPYSGTTVLYSLVSTSLEVSNLCSGQKNCCEGGPLLVDAGLLPNTHLHDPAYPQDWNAALRVYRKYWNTSKPVLVEKSVGNIDRFPRLWAALRPTGARASFIYVVRSKCFYPHEVQMWTEGMKGVMTQSEALHKAGARVKIVKYEDMLGDPYAFSKDLLEFVPELRSLNPNVAGLHGAPYVNPGDPGDRDVPLAYHIMQRQTFPSYRPGKPITLEESNWMEQLGYTEEWYEGSPFIKA